MGVDARVRVADEFRSINQERSVLFIRPVLLRRERADLDLEAGAKPEDSPTSVQALHPI